MSILSLQEKKKKKEKCPYKNRSVHEPQEGGKNII